MAKGEKLLERMRRNPRDWRIDQIETVCAAFGIACERPPGGSHYGVWHASQAEHLTVPFARPIKAVYVKRLVKFIDAVVESRSKDDG